MSSLTTGVGLISGFPIADTVNKLISLDSGQQTLLQTQNSNLQAQQLELGKLESLALGVQTSTTALANSTTYGTKAAASSNTSLITTNVTSSSSAAVGTYNFIPVQTAQTQQLLSSGFASDTQPIGAGTLTIGSGGFVNQGISLSQLNGGQGVTPGSIKITDRSGASTTINLAYAQTTQDVLDAINSQTAINVQAVSNNGKIQLIDKTGQTTSNLIVQDVGKGTTAEGLGLGGINVAANTATGKNVVSLYGNESLNDLNNGNGISIRQGVPDLQVSFQDGSTPLQIDLSGDKTVGDVINSINTAAPTKLKAQISSDGQSIQLTDLTTGSGTFSVTSPLGGQVAQQLGLTGVAVGGTITSSQLNAGLATSLLSSLNGGNGIGKLGNLSLTDRSGATATVDLSHAQTLDDVINSINGAGLGINASYNAARNGIQLTDTTGATTSNFIVANGDSTDSATKLQIAANSTSTTVNSGSLDLQSVSTNTLLSSLNGGQGISQNQFIVSDSNGSVGTINLANSKFQTIGDVINGINGLGIGVKASINSSGDGIQLQDTANGSLQLKVRDVGTNGNAAKELNLAGTATTQTIGGTPTQILNGSNNFSIAITSTDTLQSLVTKINASGAAVTASEVNVGSGSNPYRLLLTSNNSGAAGENLVDTSGVNFSLSEITQGQNAIIASGTGGTGAGAVSGLVYSSSTNSFTNAIPGVTLTVNGTSNSAVNVNVTNDNSSLVSTIQNFVSSYNSLNAELTAQNTYTSGATSQPTLFGSATVLNLSQTFSSLLSGPVSGGGKIVSIGQLGLSFDSSGNLQLDTTQLNTALQSDPADVQNFFSASTTGLATQLNNLIKADTSGSTSLLEAQKTALQNQIDANTTSINNWTTRLATERTLLTNQFNDMETALASLQTNQASLASLAQLAGTTYTTPTTSSSTSSTSSTSSAS